MSDFIPRIYGKYYLIDRIAVGGMAEVYTAKTFSEAGFEKTLVIKRILSRYSENRGFVSMFIDEAKISVALQHANIVQVFDFGRINDNYYLAMEWVDGRDLKRLYRRLKQRREILPQDFAVFIAHEVCKGLDYAHKLRDYKGEHLGVVHQDISPSNVVVGFNGEVKIVDFGIAKTQALVNDVKDGINWGKVQYVAPERLRNLEPTPRSDIFSVGVCLHELLTGRGLFRERDPKASARRVLSGDYPAPSIYNPSIGSELDGLVMRALALKPGNRFDDAGEFQERLFDELDRSPAAIQRSLAEYMSEIFAEERREQQELLVRGSRKAFEFHASLGSANLNPAGPSGSVPLGSGLLDALRAESWSGPIPEPGDLDADTWNELSSEGNSNEPSQPRAPGWEPAEPPRRRAAHVHGVRRRPEAASVLSTRAVVGIAVALGLVGGLLALRGSDDTLPAADVVSHLERSLPAAQDDEGLRVKEGWAQVRKGNKGSLASARAAFEEAVAADPLSPSALAGLALVYAGLSESRPELGRDAFALLSRAEGLDPTSVDTPRARAGVHVAFGQAEEAEEAARKCLTTNAGDTLCQLFLGEALQLQGQLDAAEEELDAALLDLTESAPAHRVQARIYVGQGRLAAARELLEGFSERSAHPAMETDLANLYARAGDYERALELVESALQQNPAAPRASLVKAELQLYVLDQPEEADALLSELSEASVGDRELGLRILVQAANAALAAGDPERAEQLGTSAVKARFGWAPGHYVQARARMALGDPSGAARSLSHVDQDSVEGRMAVRYRYGAAMLLLADQRLRIAQLEFEVVLAQEPGFWWARVALAEVLRQRELPEEAARLLEAGWRHDIEQEFVRDLRVLVVVPEPHYEGHLGANCLFDPDCEQAPGVSSPWAGRVAFSRGRYGEAMSLLPAEPGFVDGLRSLSLGGTLGDYPGLHRRRALDLLPSDPLRAQESAARAHELDPEDTVATALLLGLPTQGGTP